MYCRIYNLPDHRHIQLLDSSADDMNPEEQEGLHLSISQDRIEYWEIGFRIHNCIHCGFPNLIGVVTVDREISGSIETCAVQKCSFCQEKLTENGEIIRDDEI